MIRPFVVYTSQIPLFFCPEIFASSFHLRFLYQTYTSEHPKLLSTHTEGQSIKTYNHFFLKKSTILQLKRNSLFESCNQFPKRASENAKL